MFSVISKNLVESQVTVLEAAGMDRNQKTTFIIRLVVLTYQRLGFGDATEQDIG